LKNGKNAYGRGSWASSLRYHNGVFYASTFSSTTNRTHVYTTKDIERGPWKETAFSPSLHDHSLFFDDDGRTYMVHGGGDIRLVELNVDASGIKPGGVNQVIVKDAGRVAGERGGLPAEGSHLRKIDGKYYLMNITWPRGDMRTQIVHRADKITGPYEGRVALHDQGIAQGGLIDTPDGQWYALLFQDHGAVGRIPYLVPVKWEDGWPVLGIDGKAPMTLSIPAGEGKRGQSPFAGTAPRVLRTNGDSPLFPLANIVASDEFARRPGEPAIPLAWQWNHNPDNRCWSLTARPGWLRLTTGGVDADLLHAHNTLTQRTFGPQCSGMVAIDATNMKDGDFAGLGAFQKKYGFVAVKMADGARSIVAVSAETDAPVEVESVPLNQKAVFLKVDCDYRNRTDKAYFYYSLDGERWTAIGKPLKMTYTLPHFMGYRFALFNFATKTAGGSVDFDYFRVSDKIAAAK
jgi:beta-xylosidase